MSEQPSRREQILATAAELFAQRGFHGVSIVELGSACGISGPALYKHFPSKEALLAELLVGISEDLLTEGTRRARRARGAPERLDALIAWHVDFALRHRALIVLQDRDWDALPDDAREQVRITQRAYVDLWARAIRRLDRARSMDEARARAHATFGLINSTPHSGLLPDEEMAPLLATMARAALA